MSIYWNDGTSLYHYGIPGMIWGVRNGPPYPLGAEQKTKKEKKKDYQDEYYEKGRKKTGTIKNVIKQYKEKRAAEERLKRTSENIKKDIEEVKKGIDYADLQRKSDLLNGIANELGEDYDKLYKDLARDPKFVNDMAEKVVADLKSYNGHIENSNDIDMSITEVLSDNIKNYYPRELLDKLDLKEKYENDYWDTIHSYADRLVEKYANAPSPTPYYNSAKEYIRNNLWDDDNQSWNAYLFRHFEDYWVNDKQSKYDLESLIEEAAYDLYYK